MNLSARLEAVANLVSPYRTVVDIGSDHGYLPLWLVQTRRVTLAIAGEVQIGPLEAVRRTIRETAMEGEISARFGDGLQVVVPGEVEVAVIAGMGGKTIKGILERSPAVLNCLKRLVCQPMAGALGLRRWLVDNGWKIVEEDLVLEDGRLYEVLAAEPGDAVLTDELMLEIGPILWQRKHPLLSEHLRRLKRQYEDQALAMERAKSKLVLKKRESCLSKIRELEVKMLCL